MRAWAGAAMVLVALLGLGAPAGAGIEVEIYYPPRGTTLDPREPTLVVGEAFLHVSEGEGLDAVVAVDVSTSTEVFAGIDVDGDGAEEREAGVLDDSVLAAEIAAAGRVIDELLGPDEDPAAPERAGALRHRVGLVRFSGSSPEWWKRDDPPAEVVHPLTGDRASLRESLARLRPDGMTDLAAALDAGLEAAGPEQPGRDRLILLFTDGRPTRPYDAPYANRRAAAEAAERCRAAGVRVHTFGIGDQALVHPVSLVRIADETRGMFMAVERLEDLADVAAWVARSSVQQVEVRNVTTGESASRVHMARDGSWSALIGLRPGPNRVRVTATGLGGVRATAEIRLLGRTGTGPQQVPRALGEHREVLLEEQLARTRQKVIEHSEALRRALAEQMERERARQRRELTIERERDPR